MKDKVKRSKLKRFVAKNLLKYYVAYLHNFNRGKLKHNLLTRKEKESPLCTNCGACCVNCEAYEKECNLWEYQDILRCKEWPITPWQLKLDNLEDKCRYYWEEKQIKDIKPISDLF